MVKWRSNQNLQPEMVFSARNVFSAKFEVTFWLEMAFCQICLKSLTSQSIERFGSPLMAESFQACFQLFWSMRRLHIFTLKFPDLQLSHLLYFNFVGKFEVRFQLSYYNCNRNIISLTPPKFQMLLGAFFAKDFQRLSSRPQQNLFAAELCHKYVVANKSLLFAIVSMKKLKFMKIFPQDTFAKETSKPFSNPS